MPEQSMVSVIMPVYGVERFLERAVDSVCRQTYSQFELILVDDASPDRSGALCDRLALADSRIRVIHKPFNEGLGFARNTGLQSAKGVYAYFIDSDDEIHPDTLAGLVSAIESGPFDLAICGYTEVHFGPEGQLVRAVPFSPANEVFQTGQALHDAFARLDFQTFARFVWNKLFRLSIILEYQLKFQKAPMVEDIIFNLDYFDRSASAILIDKCYYQYSIRPGTTLSKDSSLQNFELVCEKYEKEKAALIGWNSYHDASRLYLSRLHLRSTMTCISKLASAPDQPRAGQLARIALMLVSPLTQNALKDYHKMPLKEKLVFWPIRAGRPVIALQASRLLQSVKRKLPGLYSKAKS